MDDESVCPIRPENIYINDNSYTTDCCDTAEEVFGRRLWRHRAHEVLVSQGSFDFSEIKRCLAECRMVAVEVWAGVDHEHVFILVNTTENIYIIDSYINERRVEKRPFDLDKFREFVNDIHNILDYEIQTESPNKISEMWGEFWNVKTPELPEGDSYVLEVFITPYLGPHLTFY